jgi:hypothetical protein
MKVVGIALLVFASAFGVWLWNFANTGLVEIGSSNQKSAYTMAYFDLLTLEDADRYQIVNVTGASNSLFGGDKNGYIVMDKGLPYGDLKAGMFAVRKDADALVFHRVAARSGNSWIMAGDGNIAADQNLLTEQNFQGIAVNNTVWRY